MIEEQTINKSSKGWQVKKLGELCKPKEGLRRGPFGSAIKKEFFVPDGYKVYEQSNAIYDDVQRGRYFIDGSRYQELINFNVLPGDLIVSCSGTLGRIAEIPSNAKAGVINQALLRIRLLDDVVSKKYFLYYFRSASFQKKIFDQSQGTAMSNLIGIKDFKEIELYIPSLKEQQQIVSKIEELFSELDKGIEELKTAQQQLKVYRQAVLKWAFEGKLTNEDVKDGELPKGWELKDIKSVCTNIKVGIVIKPTQFYSTSENGIKAFRSANVREFQVNDSDWVYFSKEGNEINYRTKLKEGDVLLVRSGYPGTSCVVPKKFEGTNAIDILIATPNMEIITSEYLCCFNNSPLGKGLFKSNSRGVAQKHLNVGEYSKLKISIPSIEEQQQIVQEIESRLSVCDKIEETINDSLKQAETLRQSILKKAFEGSL